MTNILSSRWSSLIIMSALLGAAAVAFTIFSADAHQDPALCNASGLQQFPSIVSPAGTAYDGDTITYAVTYVNSDPDGGGQIAPCNVTGADATITLPDGSVLDILTDETLNVGDSISCPTDPECSAGPYTYTVDHNDENGGGSSVTAEFDIAGDLHQDADEEDASDHDTLSKTIIHPGTLTSVSSSEESVQTGGQVTLTVTEQNDGEVDLTNPHVILDPGNVLLDETHIGFSGDAGDVGVLDAGETWTWTVDVTVSGNTTYTATGHGTDPNGNDITWCADVENPGEDIICDQSEQDSVDVTTIDPSTAVSIESSAAQVQEGGSVDITVTETNDGDVALTSPSVEIHNGAVLISALVAPPDSGDTGNDGILGVGEVWTWTFPLFISEDTTFTATGHGTDTLGNDVTWTDGCEIQEPEEGVLCDPEEQDEVTITTVAPSTITSIDASASEVAIGGTVTLTITEQNDGEVDLSNPHVILNPGNITLDETHLDFDGTDGGDAGVLDAGETWTWTVDVTVNDDTTYTATGHGTDALGNDVTWCADEQNPGEDVLCDQDEQDAADVRVLINPSTDVSAEVDIDVILVGDEVTLTITESNDGDVDLTNPFVDLQPLGLTLDENSAEFIGGDAGDLGVLDPGETWTWEVTDTPASDTTYIAIGHGTDPEGDDITWCEDVQNPGENVKCDQDERATVDVDTTSPSTEVTIESSASEVSVDGTVTLTITETNDGDVDLLNAFVEVDNGVGTLDETHPNFSSDGNNDSTLAVGETWTWTVDVVVGADTTYTATGHGEDALGNDVTWCENVEEPGEVVLCDQDEQASVSVTVLVQFAGCTPGYWRQAQHYGSWEGYEANDSFDDVFGVDVTIKWSLKGKPGDVTDPTLLQALTANGGGVNALARHATAALLNAAALGDDYPFTEAEIMQMVQDAVADGDFSVAGDLADANENSELGCTLGLNPGEFPEGSLGEAAVASEPVAPANNGKGPKTQ